MLSLIEWSTQGNDIFITQLSIVQILMKSSHGLCSIWIFYNNTVSIANTFFKLIPESPVLRTRESFASLVQTRAVEEEIPKNAGHWILGRHPARFCQVSPFPRQHARLGDSPASIRTIPAVITDDCKVLEVWAFAWEHRGLVSSPDCRLVWP